MIVPSILLRVNFIKARSRFLLYNTLQCVSLRSHCTSTLALIHTLLLAGYLLALSASLVEETRKTMCTQQE